MNERNMQYLFVKFMSLFFYFFYQDLIAQQEK